MHFKRAETEAEKDKLKDISNEDFWTIGHEPDDYEMDYDSFKQHEIEVKEYLMANLRDGQTIEEMLADKLAAYLKNKLEGEN